MQYTDDNRAKFEALVGEPDGRGCMEWQGRVHKGYGQFSCNYDNAAHRHAWRMHHGVGIPPGMLVRHLCHNPLCVNPAHLELGTAADNYHDNRTTRRPHAARVSVEDVEAARIRYFHGRTPAAKLWYGLKCDKSTGYDILYGRLRRDARMPPGMVHAPRRYKVTTDTRSVKTLEERDAQGR